MTLKDNERIIREATVDDANDICLLLKQLGYQSSVIEVQNRIIAFEKTKSKIFLALQNNLIIGQISVGIFEQLWTNGPCCHIDTFVVEKTFRGQGIGKKLLEFAESYALGLSCKIIQLITANRRKSLGSHTFYKSLGYRDHIHFDFSYYCKDFSTQHK